MVYIWGLLCILSKGLQSMCYAVSHSLQPDGRTDGRTNRTVHITCLFELINSVVSVSRHSIAKIIYFQRAFWPVTVVERSTNNYTTHIKTFSYVPHLTFNFCGLKIVSHRTSTRRRKDVTSAVTVKKSGWK